MYRQSKVHYIVYIQVDVIVLICTDVDSFTWQANGRQIDDGEGVDIKTETVKEAQNICMSTLKLTVTSTDNATNITCYVVSLLSMSPGI